MIAHPFTQTAFKKPAFTFLLGLTLFVASLLLLSSFVRADIEFPVEELTAKFKKITPVPILLPSYFPPVGDRVYFNEQADSLGYFISFTATPDCGTNACIYGGMSAESNGFYTPISPPSEVRNQYQKVSLANGIEGFFYNSCRTECSGVVEWKYERVLYRIVLTDGTLEELKAMANSAIKAGPR